MKRRQFALVPNARNPVAESIRNRTRCAICHERIETGQLIEVDDEAETQVHVKCLALKGGT